MVKVYTPVEYRFPVETMNEESVSLIISARAEKGYILESQETTTSSDGTYCQILFWFARYEDEAN